MLFTPARGGCHLNDRVFNKDVFKKAAEDVGREDLSADDLRRFAGSKNAVVATLTENMARLGHKTVGAAMDCQHSRTGVPLGYIESRAQATPKTATRETRVSGTPKRKKVPDEYPPGCITIRFV